jgi:hypothetical protein
VFADTEESSENWEYRGIIAENAALRLESMCDKSGGDIIPGINFAYSLKIL